MRENKQPFVRFFASDWLAGTRGMTAEETGVYITLIAMMYERCDPLPEDPKRLSRQCGCSQRAFERALETLVGDGKITRMNGHLWNARVQKEFDFRQKKSSNSKRAVEARERKRKEIKDSSDRAMIERSSNPEFIFHIPESRKKKEAADAASGRFKFEGKVVRLTAKDFDRWCRSFCSGDEDWLRQLLQQRDDWLSSDEVTPADRKKWFIPTSNWLGSRVGRERERERRGAPERTVSPRVAIDDVLKVGRG
jgi:uncharacterized protein YdaU (DUF1376 family)